MIYGEIQKVNWVRCVLVMIFGLIVYVKYQAKMQNI